jgi:serine/threonine protein kinase/tetratricopeptide (TPR) repeat protein
MADSDRSTAQVTRYIHRFEEQWQHGRRPALLRHLPPPGEPARREALRELACLDLTYRIRGGDEVPLVELYLQAFPQELGDPADRLELIATEYQECWRRGDPIRRDDYRRRFPDLAAALDSALTLHWTCPACRGQTTVPDETAEMQTCAACGRSSRLRSRPSPIPPEPAAGLPAVPGYEVLEELGRGGMGVVYKALQKDLNRLVVLKMILSGQHADAEELARFRREAEAVARLQHPNIVGIHQIGVADGLPFFSMEFVAGGSLAAGLDGTPWPPPAAAALLETLARAIHVAHQAGIVHRDLKPANVLLSAACGFALAALEEASAKPQAASQVPKITDFGLAKRLDDSTVHTGPGAVLGTPSYMAPEQAGAVPTQITPAADVYALGAILYELLTGRPPFKAATALDTVLQVLQQEPVGPRRLNAQVPRDLETICLKCLAKEPRKRYASAADLADDLRRFQAGQPIRARPVGPLERGYRWCRRNPVLAGLFATVAVLLVGVAVVSAVGYLKVRTANVELLAERHKADRNAEQFRKSYDLARRSMEQTVFGIAEEPLLKDRGFFALRKQLLAPAGRFYRELAALEGDDPRLEADRGRAHGRLAAVRGMLGEIEQAAADYRAMLDVFTSLVRAYPDEPSYRLEQARAYRGLGATLRDLGRQQEAGDAFTQGGELARDLVARFPDVADHHHELAEYQYAQGVSAYRAGRFEEALAAFGQTLRLKEDTVRRFSETRTTRDERATLLKSMGASCVDLKRYREALAHFEAARAIRQQLVAEAPNNPEYRMSLAAIWENLGMLHQMTVRLDDADRATREALRQARLLVGHFPMLPDGRHVLAHNCHNLAALLVARNRYTEAYALHQEATALLERLVEEFPAIPAYRQDLGMHYITRGKHFSGRDPEGALSWADRAMRVLSEARAIDPRNPTIHEWLGKAYLLRLRSLHNLGRHDEAVRTGERAQALDARLAKEPLLAGGLYTVRWTARQQLVPALWQASLGRHAQAARAANTLVETRLFGSLHAFAGRDVLSGLAALAVARSVAGRDGPVGETYFNAACVFARCARAAGKGAPELAEAYAARAVQMLTRARDEGFFATPANRKLLETDSDMKPLRGRKDFQELASAVLTQGKK